MMWTMSGRRKQVAQTITMIKHAVNLGGAAIVLLLIGVASMIIANTIKITVFDPPQGNRHHEVCGRNGYVYPPALYCGRTSARPALRFGGLPADLGAAIPCWYTGWQARVWAGSTFLTENLVPFGSMALPLMGCFLFVGVAIGTLGSIIFVRKYLKAITAAIPPGMDRKRGDTPCIRHTDG